MASNLGYVDELKATRQTLTRPGKNEIASCRFGYKDLKEETIEWTQVAQIS